MAGMRILLAEDDMDDREFFFSFLEDREDLALMPAVENGVELFEYLEKINDPNELPNAIVLDHNMPKRNGLQTLQLLKSNAKYAHIPVMIYTTYADEKLLGNSAAEGATIVLTKPTTAQDYNDMIDEFIAAIG